MSGAGRDQDNDKGRAGSDGTPRARRAKAPQKPRRPAPKPPETGKGEDPRVVLGRVVHRHRIALGISQEDFADRTGLDRTYVSGIERGVRNPTLLVLWRLAKAFGISPRQLFEDDT